MSEYEGAALLFFASERPIVVEILVGFGYAFRRAVRVYHVKHHSGRVEFLVDMIVGLVVSGNVNAFDFFDDGHVKRRFEAVINHRRELIAEHGIVEYHGFLIELNVVDHGAAVISHGHGDVVDFRLPAEIRNNVLRIVEDDAYNLERHDFEFVIERHAFVNEDIPAVRSRFGVRRYGHVVVPADQRIGERRGFAAFSVAVDDTVLPVSHVEGGILINYGRGLDYLESHGGARFHGYRHDGSVFEFHAAVKESERYALFARFGRVIAAHDNFVARKRNGFGFAVGVADRDVHVARVESKVLHLHGYRSGQLVIRHVSVLNVYSKRRAETAVS